MADELVFRGVFSILFLSYVVTLRAGTILSTHRWVTPTVRGPAPGQPTEKVLAAERLLLVVLVFWYGGALLYIFLPAWIAFLSFSLPDWFRLSMAVVVALSIPLLLWSYLALGRGLVQTLDPAKFADKSNWILVTSGPYHYSRNPIYAGSFIFWIALALLAANWLILLPVFVIMALVSTRIGPEEKMLLDKFGDEYRDYMKRTPRLVPRLRRPKD